LFDVEGRLPKGLAPYPGAGAETSARADTGSGDPIATASQFCSGGTTGDALVEGVETQPDQQLFGVRRTRSDRDQDPNGYETGLSSSHPTRWSEPWRATAGGAFQTGWSAAEFQIMGSC
jgi:hypothetical protein